MTNRQWYWIGGNVICFALAAFALIGSGWAQTALFICIAGSALLSCTRYDDGALEQTRKKVLSKGYKRIVSEPVEIALDVLFLIMIVAAGMHWTAGLYVITAYNNHKLRECVYD